MNKDAIVVIGLPESGKTTFLAALWHVISSQEMDSMLKFHSLSEGDSSHLNAIAARWCEAKVQDRTNHSGMKMVSMNLVDRQGRLAQVAFPDVPGEEYLRMWENRECEQKVAEILQTPNVLLFIHANAIKVPNWVSDMAQVYRQLKIDIPAGDAVIPWQAEFAPTQVQLVELLQLLQCVPLDIGHRRVAIICSAWDKVQAQNETPEKFLSNKLPLLAQYLRQNTEKLTCAIYGLSAQGGDYDALEPENDSNPETERLKELPNPADRIKVMSTLGIDNDITAPLAWLMNRNDE